jgi:negative regulator of flagellin synthesis FlgM
MMSDVDAIRGTASTATLRVFANQSARTTEAGASAPGRDRVEISELAAFLSRLAELPEDRARKVVEVRQQIANGTYETSEKLDRAVERLAKDL